MGRSRKVRRRAERARAKRQAPRRSFSPLARVALAAAGVLAILAGIALLTHGTPAVERRLGRVGGILILLGLVAIAAAVLGWL